MGPDQGIAVTTIGLVLGPNIAEDIKELEEKVAKQVRGNLTPRPRFMLVAFRTIIQQRVTSVQQLSHKVQRSAPQVYRCST